jgi:acetyl esterase
MREPSKKFLAAVEDSYLATKWVSDHALELGIDPERIAVGGDSSRGTLAAVDCQFARQAGSPGFALKALLCRVTNVGSDSESRKAFAQRYFFDKATIEWSLEHYCPTGVDLGDPRISPLRH